MSYPPTDRPMESPEFFAVEAGEYLDKLRILASRAEESAVEQFAELCRSLRGSSLMANQEAIGRSAAALERLAVAVKEGRLPWNHHTRGVACRTVDDIFGLVSKMGDWSAGENALTEAIVAELDALTGSWSPATEPMRDPASVPFVSRQGAALAGAIEDLIHAHESAQPVDQSLERARDLIGSLTGLATLAEFPPLPELLQGIDQVLESDVHPNQLPGHAIPVLRAGVQALMTGMSELQSSGRADADSEDVQQFANALRTFTESESEIVPIESLLFDEDRDGTLVPQATPGAAGAAREDLDSLEMVSLGEGLELAAEEIHNAISATQRDFRANALRQTLHGLSGVTSGPMQIALSDFSEAALDAIALGSVTSQTEIFVRHLRDAAGALTASASDEQRAAHLFDVAAEFRALTDQVEAAEGESLAPTPLDVTLGQGQVPAFDEVPHLASSWTHYEELATASAPNDTATEQSESGSFDAAPGSDSGADPGSNEEVVPPITELCYRGRDATLRALTLREEILSSISDDSADPSRIAELVEEVFDLVQLGLDEEP